MLQNFAFENHPTIGFFSKQSELMRMLPEIPKLRNIFDLFVVNECDQAAGGEDVAGK